MLANVQLESTIDANLDQTTATDLTVTDQSADDTIEIVTVTSTCAYDPMTRL